MARHVNVVMVDDLDGTSAAAETVRFGLDGTEYEIDLSAEHAATLRDTLSTYTGKGRRVQGDQVDGRRRRRPSKASASEEPSASEVRRWAREHNWPVPDRGRVSAEVRKAFADAH